MNTIGKTGVLPLLIIQNNYGMRNEFLGEKPGGSFTKKSFQHVKERKLV